MLPKAIARIWLWLRKPDVCFPLLLTLTCAGLTLFNPSVIDDHLETLLVDYRFKIRNLFLPPRVPEDIVVIAIDEKSLSEYGRWPWSRKLQAALIETVLRGGPKVIALDVFHPEPESEEADQAMAKVFALNKDKVAVALGFEVENGKTFQGEVPEVLYENAIMSLKHLSDIRPVDAFRVLLPPETISAAARFGHVYALPDRDGKLRWETLYLRYGDEYFPSLALQAAAIALGIPFNKIHIVGGVGVRLGKTVIPTDEFGRLHINYLGREGTIRYISAADVIAGRFSPERLKDSVVFIGTSAIATYDMKITPFSANMPGVEKNASVVANILHDNFILRAPLSVDLLVVLVLGGFLIAVGARFKALHTVVVFGLVALLLTLVNVLGFSFYGIRMNLLYPLGLIVTDGMLIISYRYFREEASAREIRRIFSSYVTERVVNELIRNPEMARLGGERREITVLFSDIRGFTTFSEAHPPEAVVSMLNEFLEAMTGVIFKWEGTLDKFVGDEIVAFWGAPLVQENHAELAVRCALNMIDRLKQLQEKWASEGKVPLDIGVGINTGDVIVGNIGAEGKKMDYTVIGDHVNLGARVEALTRRYNCHILTTEFTLEKIRDLFKPGQPGQLGHLSVKGLERVIVKGKGQPVGLYEICSLEPGSKSVLTECETEGIVRLEEK